MAERTQKQKQETREAAAAAAGDARPEAPDDRELVGEELAQALAEKERLLEERSALLEAAEARAAKAEEDAGEAARLAAEAMKRAEDLAAEIEVVDEDEQDAQPEQPADIATSVVQALIASGLIAPAGTAAPRAGKEVGLSPGMDARSLEEQLEGTVTQMSDADGPEDELEEPAVFRSKSSELNVIVRGRRRRVGDDGEQTFTVGQSCSFAPNGEFRTRSRRIAEFLRRRPTYNSVFFEVGREPGRAPDPEIVLERIMECLLTLDDAGLEEIQRAEEQTHRRELVLSQVKAARTKIAAMAGATA